MKKLPKYADSIAQAASMLSDAGVQCSVHDLKRAKRDGCPAFKASRVYFAPLEKWLAERLAADPADEDGIADRDTLERRKLHEQVLTIRHRRLVEEGEYIEIDADRRNTIAAIAEFRAGLESVAGEAPVWSGLDPAEIQGRLRARFDELLKALHDAFTRMNRAA